MSAVMRLWRRRTMMMVVVSRRRRRRRGRAVRRSGVHHRAGPQNIQGSSHEIHDVRCQTDSVVALMVTVVSSVMVSGEGGGSDDDGGETNGGFQNRVLHFSSPVLRFSALHRRFLTIKRFDFRIIVLSNEFFVFFDFSAVDMLEKQYIILRKIPHGRRFRRRKNGSGRRPHGSRIFISPGRIG